MTNIKMGIKTMKQIIKSLEWRIYLIKRNIQASYYLLRSKLFGRDTDKYFVGSPLESKIYHSPSGKYQLVISKYPSREGCWSLSRGEVFRTKDLKLIGDVKRNYYQFPFAWAEGHKNGHDYLICGEDYQGQTIIELDTGERKDYLPFVAYKGFGFCWASICPSPDLTKLLVSGCIWAAPYEIVVYDFTNPLSLPYKELFRDWDVDGAYWTDKGTTIEFDIEKQRRKSDNKDFSELTDDEQDKAIKNKDWEDFIEHKEIKC